MIKIGRSSDGRIRLSILGGYLGAGKSTWLRHQLHAGRFGRSHIVVNEAAEIPIDHLVLGKAESMTILAGGCCCCNGAAAFVQSLREICDRQNKEGANQVDHIVLETSGLANPSAIAALLQTDPVLARRISLSEIRVVVDAAHGIQHLTQDALSLKQIEAADELLIAKIDLTTRSDISQLLATLRLLNPGAQITATIRGDDVPLDYDVSAEPFRISSLATASEPMRAERVDVGAATPWADVSVWLSALLHAHGDEIVRVKGCLRTPAGCLLLQSVKRQVQPPEIMPDSCAENENVLVFIGRNVEAKLLAESLSNFTH